MLVLTRLRTLLRNLFWKQQVEQDLGEELTSHLELLTDQKIKEGMNPVEAARAARIELGGVEQVKERVRASRAGLWLDAFLHDLHFGLRMLRKNPGFTAVAVVTLALGIGANTAVFSIVNAVLLRSLPFRNPDELVAIYETHPSIPEIGVATADLSDWEAQARSFEGLAAYGFVGYEHLALTVNSQPEEIRGAIASHDLFPLLGIAPALGRNFLPVEDEQDRGQVAILSGELWKTHFSADPKVLGQSVTLNGKAYTIVGVLPPAVRFPQDVDVWVPLGNLDEGNRTNRFYHPLFVIGRLRPGTTLAAARTEMTGLALQFARAYPQTNHDIGVKLEPIQEKYIGGLATALFVLWGAVALVLLIACANVASLLLARATNREDEMAVRRALGASYARLICQGLTESVLLGGIGGFLGLIVAWATTPLLSSWLLGVMDVPILRLHQIRIDPHVLAVTAGVSVLSGLLFGIVPALGASRDDADSMLQSSTRSSPSRHHSAANRVAIAGEVALAVVILTGAGLLIRSLQRLSATSPGLRPDHILTLRISLPKNEYDSAGDSRNSDPTGDFYQRLLPRLLALPGVEGAATIDQTLFGNNASYTRFLVDGAPPVRPGDYPTARFRNVSPGYFQTMGIALLGGRGLEPADLRRTPNPAVVNRTLVKQFFPGQDPVGQKLIVGISTGRLTEIPIVGVVSDVRDISIDSPAPAEMYFAGFTLDSTLVVRSTVDSTSLSDEVSRAVLTEDPSQPIYEVRTADQLLDDSMSKQRLSATLLGLFSLLALVLAASGIYGLTSYTVAGRTREIGLRIALGAERGDILQLVLRQEMLAAAIGAVAGVAASLLTARLLASLLYGVSAYDPATYAAVLFALVCAALLACYLPARRATRVDPMVALRHE
jgi:predicted permease